MKNLALIFLLICSIAVQSRTIKINSPTIKNLSTTNDNSIPKVIIGKWVNVNNDVLNIDRAINSITFHANSKINIAGKDNLVVQNYQVFMESNNYRIELQELITRKPITDFTILMVNKDTMILILKGKSKPLILTFKKAETSDKHLLPVVIQKNIIQDEKASSIYAGMLLPDYRNMAYGAYFQLHGCNRA